jgi:twitching motility protein PilU
VDIGYFLKLMVDKGASDMFLTTGAPVNIKVEGKLYPLGNTGLPSGMVKKIAYSLMDEGQVPQFERDLELNMALAVKEAGRFRINVFKQRGEVGMVIRAIKSEIPSVEQLQLPTIFRDLIMEPRGLILVVGATGSGKSTTLAAMIDHRNTIHPATSSRSKIRSNTCTGTRNRSSTSAKWAWTRTLSRSAKNAMREAPDVIMIGEIRDTDTMEAAIAFSETGHLCLATLHSNNADQTLERILNFFPESAHKNVLMNLALNLRAVISQRLVTGKDGRRIPAVEVLLNTPFIRDMIRRGQIHEIKEAMDRSLQEGMQTFDQSLYRLYKEGRIELEEALAKSDSRDGLALKIRLSEGGEELSQDAPLTPTLSPKGRGRKLRAHCYVAHPAAFQAPPRGTHQAPHTPHRCAESSGNHPTAPSSAARCTPAASDTHPPWSAYCHDRNAQCPYCWQAWPPTPGIQQPPSDASTPLSAHRRHQTGCRFVATHADCQWDEYRKRSAAITHVRVPAPPHRQEEVAAAGAFRRGIR